MAKRIIWTSTAKTARIEILKYWIEHNQSKNYARKLSKLFRAKTALLATEHYLGKPTNYNDVRVSLVSYFSIFYKITASEIIIVGIWDNRRNPEDLIKNLEI